jgi:4-azaleucine resistance transporter AzlC
VRRAAVTLGAAVGVFGVSFGVVATGAGLSIPMVCAFSVFVFTGATQFAAVGVLASGGTPLAAIASGLLLGARHLGYALALHPLLPAARKRRLLAAQFLIDESTAFATSQSDKRDAPGAFWWAGLSVFVAWNIGTLIGAVFGDALGDPADLGLDAVFPAAFLALLVPLVRDIGGRAAALGGAVIALALVPFTPAGVPIIVAAAGTLVGLRFAPPHDDPNPQDGP